MASPSTALTSTPGRTSINVETGVPRQKGVSHGTKQQTHARTHLTRRSLAHRQSHLRTTHLRKHWHKRSRGSPSALDAPTADGKGDQALSRSPKPYVQGGGNEVSGGKPTQAQPGTGCTWVGDIGPIHRGVAGAPRSSRHTATLRNRPARSGYQSGHDQSRSRGSATDLEPVRTTLARRVGSAVAGHGTADPNAAPSQQTRSISFIDRRRATFVLRARPSPRQDGTVQSEHGLTGARGRQPSLELGDPGA